MITVVERCCPTIATFVHYWSDALNEDERQELIEPVLISNTRSCPTVQRQRANMACDWLCQVQLPAWMHQIGAWQDAIAMATNRPTTTAMTDARIMCCALWEEAWRAEPEADRTKARQLSERILDGSAMEAARRVVLAYADDAAADRAVIAWETIRPAAWVSAGMATSEQMTEVSTVLKRSAGDLLRDMIAVRS